MTRPVAALCAQELLKEMQQAGVDPEPVYAQVADTLLKRHGVRAYQLTRTALEQMQAAGDQAAMMLWDGVRRAMTGRVASADPLARLTVH